MYSPLRPRRLFSPQRKRARTAAIDDQNQAIVKTTKGKITQHQSDKEIQVGPKFHTHFKDKRDIIHKIIEPSIQWHWVWENTGTTLSTGNAGQSVYTLPFFTGNDVRNMMYAISNTTEASRANGARGVNVALTKASLNSDALSPIPNPTIVDNPESTLITSTAAQIQPDPSAADDNQYNTSRVKIPIWQYRIHFRNPSNYACKIQIYEYASKGVYTGLDPLQAWDRVYLTQQENASNNQKTEFLEAHTTGVQVPSGFAPNSGTHVAGVTTLGEHPYGPTLKRCFKKLNYTSYDLEPGRSLEYVLNNYRKSITADEITEYIDQLQGATTNNTWQLPGWTKYIMIILHGIKCGDNANQTNITYSDARVNIAVEQSGMGWGKHVYTTQRFESIGGTAVGAFNTSSWPNVATGNERQTNEESDLPVTAFVAVQQ